MSKKPKTPDVAAVWNEVKGISNGMAALRTDVALSGNRTSLHAKQISEAFDRIAALEDPKVDINALAQQVGDIQSEVDNLQPLHAAVSMLEAKVAALTEPRSQSGAMLDQLCRLSQVDANRVCHLNRECGTVRSVVTVLVIVQSFTLIAGLAWVLGVGR